MHLHVGVLVLLQERDHEPRQRHARTVERMAELRLAVGIAEAAVETTRLIVGEARAGRNLQPLLFAGRPKFEVVAFRGRKAHVARAELKDAVMETEPLEDVFRFAYEDFKLVERGVGMDEVDHLHLVELVDAEHAARHLAGRSGFAAEARRVGGKLDRKILAGENVVAVVVGYRNFSRRDEPEIVDLAVVEIFGELGKLARARHRLGIDDERR